MQSTRQTTKSRINRALKRREHKRERRALNSEQRDFDELQPLQRNLFLDPDIPIELPEDDDFQPALVYRGRGYFRTKNGGIIDETDLAHISSYQPEELERNEGELSPEELLNSGLIGLGQFTEDHYKFARPWPNKHTTRLDGYGAASEPQDK